VRRAQLAARVRRFKLDAVASAATPGEPASLRGRGELLDQFRHDARIVDLAGSGGLMAAAVFKADGADVDRRAAIDDRLADREDGVKTVFCCLKPQIT